MPRPKRGVRVPVTHVGALGGSLRAKRGNFRRREAPLLGDHEAWRSHARGVPAKPAQKVRQVIVIPGKAPQHSAVAVEEYLGGCGGETGLACLPVGTPELNAVEGLVQAASDPGGDVPAQLGSSGARSTVS